MTDPISLNAVCNLLSSLDASEAICVEGGALRIVPAAAPPGPSATLRGFSEEDEQRLAREFCARVEDPANRARLLVALADHDLVQAFQAAVYRSRIANEWFAFRDQSLVAHARGRLNSLGVAYLDDVRAPDE